MASILNKRYEFSEFKIRYLKLHKKYKYQFKNKPTDFTRKISNDSIRRRFKSIDRKLAKLECQPTLKM